MTTPASAAITEPGRQRLPNLRGHELFDFEHAGTVHGRRGPFRGWQAR
jgi:hypothetical protein